VEYKRGALPKTSKTGRENHLEGTFGFLSHQSVFK